ncbi:cytochrome ubiquinol oxidase subunit I [Rhodopila sp.]|uniref:cytochrome ubiquinol oxidase subunit I n=1 Tax=Rhodopila sp. TaxID=2480087 RepID=UPI003D11B8D5
MIDAFHLARAQFGFTVAFHIIFPAFSIGLASFLMVLEGLWLRTGKAVYLDLFRYWIKIFSIGFAMGVVSGLVMSYQFGTNWSQYAEKAGPVIGPVMAYEVLTAFFLEAGFLGVMLFGMQRVGRKLHFLATCMVAGGTLLSAFWILSVNSWMQTPAGFAVGADGRMYPTDYWQVIFNPSVFGRVPHMVLASYLVVAFIVSGVAAWHMLHDRATPAVRKMFSMAMWMAAIVAPLQIAMGDIHGLNTLEHQPMKIAAMEGDWTPSGPDGAPLILFGLPNMARQRTYDKIEIPHLSSLILTHSWDGRVPGLKQVPPADRPYAPVVFWTFRVMVGLGFAMFGLGALSLLARRRGTLFTSRWLHRLALVMAPAPIVAMLCGWMTTEIGRQPYTVYGVLRTIDSVSPIALPGIATSLAVFAVVYFIVFGAGIMVILRMMAKPPVSGEPDINPDKPIRSAGIHPGLAGAVPAGSGGASPFPAE